MIVAVSLLPAVVCWVSLPRRTFFATWRSSRTRIQLPYVFTSSVRTTLTTIATATLATSTTTTMIVIMMKWNILLPRKIYTVIYTQIAAFYVICHAKHILFYYDCFHSWFYANLIPHAKVMKMVRSECRDSNDGTKMEFFAAVAGACLCLP